jgi:hypothetical protein
MSACNFECLSQLINKKLDLDKQIEVFCHPERCVICRDAVRQISRIRQDYTPAGAISMQWDLGARR